MPTGFKDADPANLRGLASWIDEVAADRSEDRLRVTDDLRRIADTIEDGAVVVELPEWRYF